MKAVTFKVGGIHPDDQKKLSALREITPIALPDELAVPLNQHLGKPATSLVKPNDEVTAGQQIGEADGFISAHVHSPVSGVVKKVERRMSALGTVENMVLITVDREKTEADLKAFEEIKQTDPLSCDPKELLDMIKNAGIVGQGGATFPTHVKLAPPPDKNIDLVVINAAECEPYLTADHQLMLEKPDEMLMGTRIVMHILGVTKGIIGVEVNKPDAIALLEKRIRETGAEGIVVAPLKTRYPQGGEKQLIQAVCGREVPSGKLPFDVGVMVQNVGTVVSIQEAVVHGKPLIDRITTITGYVNRPGNYRIPTGMPFEHAINEGADGFPKSDQVGAVINGGPMMGKSVRQLDVPVVKGTSGILVFSADQVDAQPEGPCIRCGRCVDACAMGLMPTELAIAAQQKNPDGLADAMDCIECGSCSYVCPTGRQLVQWIRVGKTIFRNARRS